MDDNRYRMAGQERESKMTFYFYNTDDEYLIGKVVARDWDDALKIVRQYFGYPDCNTVLRLTPHEYWA